MDPRLANLLAVTAPQSQRSPAENLMALVAQSKQSQAPANYVEQQQPAAPMPMVNVPIEQLQQAVSGKASVSGRQASTKQPSLQEMIDQIKLGGLAEQRKGITETQADLEKLQAQPKGMDYSPLFAITDSLTGSKFSQAYRPPQDNKQEIAQLRSLLSGQRGGLAKSEVDLLEAQLRNQRAEESYNLQRELMRMKRDQDKKMDLTPGEKKADELFAKDYQSWSTGGFSNVRSNLEKLQGVQKQLADPKTEIGSVVAPEWVRARTNPQSVAAEQDVGNVVFQSLKEILGGQFTEKEGQKLVQQSYDPRLSDAENTKKIQQSLKTLQQMADAKQAAVEYFQKTGTLKGFSGSSANNMEEFTKELKTKFLGDAGPKKSKAQELREKHGL